MSNHAERRLLLIIFCIIIVACTLGGLGRAFETRWVEWNNAKERCIDELYALTKAQPNYDESIVTESDRQRVLRSTSKYLARAYAIERKQVLLLQHKPFGLPLTRGERDWLKKMTDDIASWDKQIGLVPSSPATSTNKVDFLEIGLAKQQASVLLGQPTRIEDYGSSLEGPSEGWVYGNSQVYFHRGRVSSWAESSDSPLKTKK